MAHLPRELHALASSAGGLLDFGSSQVKSSESQAILRPMKLPAAFVLLPLCGLPGCGAGPGTTCTDFYVLTIGPPSAVVSSSAAPPGNQGQFAAEITLAPSGPNCAVSAVAMRAYPAWTNPDPTHITISSAADATNGLAVCKGPTAGPVTLTASTPSNTSSQPLTATVQLTCD